MRSSNIQVVIIGAGGHGIVVADIFWLMHRAHAGLTPVGFIDDDPLLEGRITRGLPVLGADYKAIEDMADAVIVAIGDNQKRKAIYNHFKNQGVQLATAIHPSAVIAGNVPIGEGSMICAGAVVNPEAEIGADVILNTACSIDHHNKIGDHAHIAPGVHLGGNVSIGEGALVGIGATVMPGCKIGAWSIVGAGAVVVGDVPDRKVFAGVPAKSITKSKR